MELMESGRLALRTYLKDKDHQTPALFNAAHDFAHVLKILRARESAARTSGDSDLTAEAQASYFWCQKLMDGQQLADLVQTKPPATQPEGSASTASSAREAVSANARVTVEPHASSAFHTVFTAFNELPVTTSIAAPSALRLKRLRQEIRERLGDDFDHHEPRPQLRLGRLLLVQARSIDDADTRYAYLLEAGRAATEGNDPATLILAATDLRNYRLEANDSGWAPRWAGRLRDHDLGRQVALLAGQPREPSANLAVGRHLCFQLGDWDHGLPLLQLGSDPQLAALAKAELAAAIADLRLMLAQAEAWEAQAGRSTAVAWVRQGCLERAAWWYRRCRVMPGADLTVNLRLIRLEQQLPVDLDRVEWSRLSATQWDQLAGRPLFIHAGQTRVGPIIILLAGERIRVVAHPDLRPGLITQQLANGAPAPCGEVTGPGPLYLLIAPGAVNADGDQRLKLVALDR